MYLHILIKIYLIVYRSRSIHQQDSRPSVGAERAVPSHVPPGTYHRQELRARQDTEHIIDNIGT